MELEEAEKYFQSEQFQANYQAYITETIERRKKEEIEKEERARKQAEYEASPQYAIDQEIKKQRQVLSDMQDAVKKDILQALHDALVNAGADCEDYEDYRCC